LYKTPNYYDVLIVCTLFAYYNFDFGQMTKRDVVRNEASTQNKALTLPGQSTNSSEKADVANNRQHVLVQDSPKGRFIIIVDDLKDIVDSWALLLLFSSTFIRLACDRQHLQL